MGLFNFEDVFMYKVGNPGQIRVSKSRPKHDLYMDKEGWNRPLTMLTCWQDELATIYEMG